jgi:hypothetical protein
MEEMRAIRAILPKWRSDQKRQQEWQDALENKIDALQKAKDGGGKEKPPPRAPAPKPAGPPKVFIFFPPSYFSSFFFFFLPLQILMFYFLAKETTSRRSTRRCVRRVVGQTQALKLIHYLYFYFTYHARDVNFRPAISRGCSYSAHTPQFCCTIVIKECCTLSKYLKVFFVLLGRVQESSSSNEMETL